MDKMLSKVISQEVGYRLDGTGDSEPCDRLKENPGIGLGRRRNEQHLFTEIIQTSFREENNTHKALASHHHVLCFRLLRRW